MTDTQRQIERIFSPPAKHEWPAIRKRQQEFLRSFGDHFDKPIMDAFWIGASADGRKVGFEFRQGDEITRVAIDSSAAPIFFHNFYIAMIMAVERMKAGQPEGRG